MEETKTYRFELNGLTYEQIKQIERAILPVLGCYSCTVIEEKLLECLIKRRGD